MTQRRWRNRGFTLLEVMVAVGLLSLIMLGVALALKNTGQVAALEASRNEMERSSQRALDVMALELRDSAARVTTVSADGSSIQFQIPADLNGNGTVLNSSGLIEFGFLDKGVPKAGTITYKFVQNVVGGHNEVLDEAAGRRKLNDDADVTDKFARGYIVRITQVTGLAAVTGPIISGRWIVQPNGSWGGDINGDGVADPIFKVDAVNGRVLVNLWAMQIDRENNQQVINCSTSICFRNK